MRLRVKEEGWFFCLVFIVYSIGVLIFVFSVK